MVIGGCGVILKNAQKVVVEVYKQEHDHVTTLLLIMADNLVKVRKSINNHAMNTTVQVCGFYGHLWYIEIYVYMSEIDSFRRNQMK